MLDLPVMPPVAPPTISKQIKRKDSAATNAKKKRVKRACLHCKKAKTSCSEHRPCERCVRLKLADSCLDPLPSTVSEDEKMLWSKTLDYLNTRTDANDNHSPTEQELTKQVLFYARKLTEEQPLSISGKIKSNTYDVKSLLRENEMLQTRIQQLLHQAELNKLKENSLNRFTIMTSTGLVAYSRWRYPEKTLLDYNYAFAELTGLSSQQLRVGEFNLHSMCHEKYMFNCGLLFLLLRENIISYVEVNQVWCVQDADIHVKSFVHINFDQSNLLREMIMFTSKSNYAFPLETLFRPIDFRLSEKAVARGMTMPKIKAAINFLEKDHQVITCDQTEITFEVILKLCNNSQVLGRDPNYSRNLEQHTLNTQIQSSSSAPGYFQQHNGPLFDTLSPIEYPSISSSPPGVDYSSSPSPNYSPELCEIVQPVSSYSFPYGLKDEGMHSLDGMNTTSMNNNSMNTINASPTLITKSPPHMAAFTDFTLPATGPSADFFQQNLASSNNNNDCLSMNGNTMLHSGNNNNLIHQGNTNMMSDIPINQSLSNLPMGANLPTDLFTTDEFEDIFERNNLRLSSSTNNVSTNHATASTFNF